MLIENTFFISSRLQFISLFLNLILDLDLFLFQSMNVFFSFLIIDLDLPGFNLINNLGIQATGSLY